MITRPMIRQGLTTWRPVTLAQAPSVTPAPMKVPLFDEPIIQVGLDFWAALTSAMLAYQRMSNEQSSTFWWVVSGMAFVKGLHDLSTLERK